MHGQECLVSAVLDGTLAVAVHEDGTLFCLRSADAAYIDEGLDYIVEGVHVVVM